ncbi:MAG: VOC family protein [Acidimicrobiales bacterium]|jgi:catechol 2,3-dioxygenase-like lactoylglutathione lyase family enzyme
MTMAHRVDHLDHVQLAMPPGGEDQAVAFYEGVLGIPRVPKPPELAIRGGCWFEHEGLRVHLGAEEDFRPAKKAHPAFAVIGVDELCGVLEAAGYPVRRAEDVPGMPQWFVHDPFGNRIELVPA